MVPFSIYYLGSQTYIHCRCINHHNNKSKVNSFPLLLCKALNIADDYMLWSGHGTAKEANDDETERKILLNTESTKN